MAKPDPLLDTLKAYLAEREANMTPQERARLVLAALTSWHDCRLLYGGPRRMPTDLKDRIAGASLRSR